MYYTFYKQVGNRILMRYKHENSNETIQKVIKDYEPSLYTRTDGKGDAQSIHGYNLKEKQFPNIWEAKEFAKSYKDVPEMIIEGNAMFDNQFIIEIFDGKVPEFQPKNIKGCYVDIEVDADEFPKPEEAKYVVNSITVYNNILNKFFTWAIPANEGDTWDQSKSPKYIQALDIEYVECANEEDLIRAYVHHHVEHRYDYVTGWNTTGFDTVYMYYRTLKILGESYAKKYSPFDMVDVRKGYDKFGKETVKIDIVGLPDLDYLKVYEKHNFSPRESLKLDFIAHAELGENKITYEESESLHTLYRDNYQLFVDYNIQDANLVKRLEDKLGFINLTFAIAYYCLTNYSDTLGTVKIWEQLVAKALYNKGQIPLYRHAEKDSKEFDGAYVKEVVTGFHDWIVAYDLASLYPHIIQQCNIGPETYIPHDQLPPELLAIKEQASKYDDYIWKAVDTVALKKYDVALSPNNEFYRRDTESFFSEIMHELYIKRKEFKGVMLDKQKHKEMVKTELASRGVKV